MRVKKSEPVYSIGVASKLVDLSPQTLRIWERKGLIKPSRIGKDRFYSECDLEKIGEIKKLTHQLLLPRFIKNLHFSTPYMKFSFSIKLNCSWINTMLYFMNLLFYLF